MQAAKLKTFMKEPKHDLLFHCLDGLVAEISLVASQLSDGLNTKIHELICFVRL